MKNVILLFVVLLLIASSCKKSKIEYNNDFSGSWINKSTGEELIFENDNIAIFNPDSFVYENSYWCYFNYSANKDSIIFDYAGPLKVGLLPIKLSYEFRANSMLLELVDTDKLPFINGKKGISSFVKREQL